ncbi:MAG: redox-regulated ATPase YchF [Chitinivibrionales bacterium]|nr:redox-regulated ATPase YchF [Chitinivibrionales bacterium]
MSLSAGIAGLPNVGKSTVFNALCGARAEAQNYPFCTIEPNHGVVPVPDSRLDRITTYHPTRKVVPAFLELVDIAGLVRNAAKGEGLGNQFLGHIKNVDAIAHIVRCFDDGDVTHVEEGVDPVRDVDIVETELMIKDLETVERTVERLAKMVKTGDKDSAPRLKVCECVRDALAAGTPARAALATEDDRAAVRDLQLLTAKKVLYVANIGEDMLGSSCAPVAALREHADAQGAECIELCGKLEAEIAELPEEDRGAFLESVGLGEPGLDVLSRALYRLLGLETFFTVSEVQNTAWTIPAGCTAARAAGVVHSDFEKNFIRADVYRLEDLETYGSDAEIRAAGKMRSEGRDYVVRDGDILYFRTSA